MPTQRIAHITTVKSAAVNGLSWKAARSTNLYIDEKIYAKGSAIESYRKKSPSIGTPSWFLRTKHRSTIGDIPVNIC